MTHGAHQIVITELCGKKATTRTRRKRYAPTTAAE